MSAGAAVASAQLQVGTLLARIPRCTSRIAAARSMLPPGDDGGADRMIETADAARPRADAQIGAEGEREKAAHQFGAR